MDKWLPSGIPGSTGATPPRVAAQSVTHQRHLSDRRQAGQTGTQQQHQSDGAFERFLTAAIATIITIMFSWRMLDQSSKPASSLSSSSSSLLPLPAGRKQIEGETEEEEEEEEERRRRRERYLSGGQTSENLFTASSSLPLSSSSPSSLYNQWSPSPLPEGAGTNISPVPSSSSSSSSSTPTHTTTRRRQLPVLPGSQPSSEAATSSSTSDPSSLSSSSSSRFQRQQEESLASRLAKISSSTSARGRAPGFRLTKLPPVIRVPVDDFPLCGEEEDQDSEVANGPVVQTAGPELEYKDSSGGHSPKQLERQDTPHPNTTNTGVISETLVDPTQLSALGIDPWSIGKNPASGSMSSRKGPVLYTDLDADSSEELVDSSIEDAESAAGIEDVRTFGDSGSRVDVLRRDLLLNISTDSDSSGGVITRDVPAEEDIVDPKHFHTVMTANLVEGEEEESGFPSRRRRPSLEEDQIEVDDEDEFFVVPGDSSYRHHHHYSGQRTVTSSNISALGDDSGYHGNSPSSRAGGIMGFPSYYYEDEDEDYDDVQPRELDSDEELYLCSVLEPIIEENSDELSQLSSGAESYSSTSSSSRGGYRARHQQHDYDVDYQERKHGLIPDSVSTPESSPSTTGLNSSNFPPSLAVESSHIPSVVSPSFLQHSTTPGGTEDESISSSKISNNSLSMSSIPPGQDNSLYRSAESLLSSAPLSSRPGFISDNKTDLTKFSSVAAAEKDVHNIRNTSGNNSKNTEENSDCDKDGARRFGAGSDFNYTSNDSLIMGIKASYSIPRSSERSSVHRTGDDPKNITSDLTERAELCDPNRPSPSLASATRFIDSGRAVYVTEAAARADGQVRRENSLSEGGDTAARSVAADPDTALRGDTHTPSLPSTTRAGGWASGGGADSKTAGDYNESRPGSGDASFGDARSVGFTQHIPRPSASIGTDQSNASSSSSDGVPLSPVTISSVSSTFASDYNSDHGFIKSVNASDSEKRDYGSTPVRNSSYDVNSITSSVARDSENNNSDSSTGSSSGSSEGDKTISYKFYSDVNSGVYSSRIIITGEKEEEVIEPSTLEDIEEAPGELNLDLDTDRCGEAIACDQLSVSFPSDSDYYEYVRCYGSSVDLDLDSPTSPRSPTNLVDSRLGPDQSQALNRGSGIPSHHSGSRSRSRLDTGGFEEKREEVNFSTERGRRDLVTDIGDEGKEGFSRGSLKRQDHTFARTFSSRVEHDSNSESDESVQTVISRKGSKASDPATSSSSTGSSHQASPVHVPSAAVASLSPPSGARPKRPLSDGCVYSATKFLREDDGRDAFYRDRIVSEGGGVAFGEEGIGDDRFETGEADILGRDGDTEGDRGYDLRAYKSYSALHTKGLDLNSDEERDNKRGVFSDSECSSPSSPYTSPAAPGFVSVTEPVNLASPNTLDADVVKKTTVTFDGSDSLTFVVKPQEIQDTNMDRPRFRLSREEEEAYTYGAGRAGYDARRVPEIFDPRPPIDQGVDDDDDDWEQSITETFVVPVTPERTIYQTLQNVKHLLDTRSPSLEQDDSASTCTTTMVEADGRNIGGWVGSDDITSGYRASADALERVDASLKERLGFQLGMDELRTEGYSTESGWPIVRYIEKERVFVEEHGMDDNQNVKEGDDSGEEYVPDYTDIDAKDEQQAEYDNNDNVVGEPMEDISDISSQHKPVNDDFPAEGNFGYSNKNYPQSYASPMVPHSMTTTAPPYHEPSSMTVPSSSLITPKPTSGPASPRPGRLGSSRSNLPPPPPPPTQAPRDRYTTPQRSEVVVTGPLYTDAFSVLQSPEAEASSEPMVSKPLHHKIPPSSPIYPSGPQPSLLPEEEDFAYLPHGDATNKGVLSPQSIPVQHSMPPPSVPLVPSASPLSSFTLLDSPPRVIRPSSPQQLHNESLGESHGDDYVESYKQPLAEHERDNESGEGARDDSYSSDGSDTRGKPPAEFAEVYRVTEDPDMDEDYDYFVKHIADGGPDTADIVTPGNLKTPLSISSGIPILSGNIASPYAQRDVFLFPGEESSPVTTGHHSSKTHSSPSYSTAASVIPDSTRPRRQDEGRLMGDGGKAEKRGVDENAEIPGGDVDEGSAKKPRLLTRTSTGTEDMGGFFSAPRRSSAASLLDDESSNALNKSFGEPSNASLSFALERYDSEPGIRSPTKEKFTGSSPFRESPMRMNSRPMSFISQEPSLDVVMEARIDTPATISSASSTASDVTVVAAGSPESPSSPSGAVSLEQSPTLNAPPPQLPLSLPPFSAVKDPEEVSDDIPSTPGESETKVLSEMEQRWDNSMKRVKKSKMDLQFADVDESRGSATPMSPPVEKDQIAQLAAKSPRILPIFVEKQNDGFLSGVSQGGKDNKGQAMGNEDPGLTDSDVAEDDGEESESNDEEEPDKDSDEKAEEFIRKDSRPVSLLPGPPGVRPINFRDHGRIPLRAGSNSVESLDENYPAESPPSSGPMSPGISSDSASAVEASPSSAKPREASSLAAPPLHATSRPPSSRMASSSPSGLTTLGQSSPLCIPFPGTAWAHAQFGQYDKPPKGPQPTTPKRSMKEVKKMSKTPYKSVLTQNPPLSFTTPPSPSPKAAAFVLPDTLMTPSRLKILNSRNRFLSEGSLQSAADDFKNEFAAHKESLLQNQGDTSKSDIPTSARLYTPKSAADSFNAKNWRYRSMEQLQKLQEMSRMTRKSESDLTQEKKGREDCLHPDCIFSEKGRREVLDKTLSIDNLHADVYKHLNRLGGSESDAGDAYFPENSSDLIDLTFNNFQNDGRGPDTFDRPHSMSELRHASDYSTISGSSGGYFSTPSSARHTASKGGRFAQHKQYKKSKSLCTLETDIDDDSFGPSSPVSPGGEEISMQRAPSAHDLRISKSLQKLNVPHWYSQSSLSKYGSLSLLKYGSNSTMSSWQQFPPSLISSPCTTPSASGNVVIKARVQPPTSARNLRSPRFPSKSAPTTPLFGSNGQAQRSGESPAVKLPSEKLRKKEKAKALMPIPIVPFDKIRAMFEKKKSEDLAAKQAQEAAKTAASPVSPVSDKSPSPTVASPLCFSPPPAADSPAHNPPRTLALNGRRNLRDEEDDVYEDVEIVLPPQHQAPPEPPSSSPPPLATSSPPVPETKPEKKRTWFPKPGKSRRSSKSPASSEQGKKEAQPPQSPQSPQSPTAPSGFQLGEMSYEPRRLRSSRSSGLDESFTSEGSRSLASRGGRDQDRYAPPGARSDMDRSRDSLRPSRPVDLERKSSVESDRSFSKDLDRVTGRAAARAAPLDLDRSGGSNANADKRDLSFRERRERELRRRSRELPDVSNVDTSSRRSLDHVDVAIARADRRPHVVEDVPKIRTWQPKPRGGRSQPQDSKAPATVTPVKAPSTNGTASGNYRYPVSGSAFSASKPNQPSGLNTPPLSRHAPSAENTTPEDEAKKSVRGEYGSSAF
ncbi:hypothetical protein ElyMa_001646800 [Elysia marginata]|uniref:Uncharacterized protein n=1 Tax=Elysia marginata TaxID=1093978 RepID=A0AAV4JQR3_9GAST|nr:hypothetical protein ElyMa_001646800 [Elysia marginata]